MHRRSDTMLGNYVAYKRATFSTRLHRDRLYTAGHLWLLEHERNVWRIGFTRFATRVLGDAVEFDFELRVDAPTKVGEVIGWVEGFKAVTDLFSPLDGRFKGGNPLLDEDISLIQTNPYGDGWLYSLEGSRTSDCVDVDGYSAVLDATIDRMLGKSA